MSSASKSKSKDKTMGKEAPKGFSKPSGQVNTCGGLPVSGYYPLLGTYHTIETLPVPFASVLHVNGHFKNIDDKDYHNGNSVGAGTEYDSVSNNGSWSGESEDHKEKLSQPPPRQEPVPGAENDKREKIRQKNEKKHLRQKERRAQELHERCSGYLMSRKLEALAQQLVGMGFSQERATMALILNEGRVEESVAWLFEGGEDDKLREHNLEGGGNLKIDISEELTLISDMEIRYKVSKQEVERAVVASEGDLAAAEETLKTQKQDPPATSPKPEENGDSHTVADGKLPAAFGQNAARLQTKPHSSSLQQKRQKEDFNYINVSVTAGSSLDPGTKNMQLLKKVPSKLECAKPHQISLSLDRRPVSGSNPPGSYSLASSLQASVPPAKMESHCATVGNELKNLQLGSLKEPVIVMQRPQSINPMLASNSSVRSSPAIATDWYPQSLETVKPNKQVSTVSGTINLRPNDVSSNPLSKQLHYQSHQQFLSTNSSIGSQGTTMSNDSSTRGVTLPTLTPASSLGLFSGLGINGSSVSSSPVDWTTGSSMPQFDYSNIDWSLNRGVSLISRSNGLCNISNYSVENNAHAFDLFRCGTGAKSGIRPVISNTILETHDKLTSSGQSEGILREWTSPFEENDLFSFPRQFVSSPSL